MAYLGVQPGSRSVRTVTTVVATAGQTVFNVNGGYVKGFVDVFVNGIKFLDPSDFTATDNLTVVLATGALLNDEVQIVAYSPLAIYSVVSKAGDAMTGNLTVPNLISTSNVSGSNGYFVNLKVDSNTVVNSSLTITGNTNQTGDVTLTGNLNLSGSLIITGAATSVSTQSLAVEDSIIIMASNNTTDTLDIGFAGSYNNGSANVFTGIVRNATDKEYYVFDSYDTTPGNDIDLNDPSFKIANLHANFNGNLQSNSISVVQLNATNGNFTSSILLTGDASGYRQNTTTVYGGDAGVGFGRLEYHDNRWIINSGSDSSNVAVFQRGNLVKSFIDNNGSFNGSLVITGTVTANGGTGSANQVLTSNGTGVYWAAATAGASVAGTNTTIQFNDSGSLGGVANLTFDKLTNVLSIGNSTVNTVHSANGVIVAGDTGVVPASNTIGTTLGTSTARWVLNANTGDFTGVVNAASYTTTGFVANTTAITPTSNTILLGNSTGRFVISANTIDTSGNTNTFGTAAYVVANGNVGIGTASPTTKLDVVNATDISMSAAAAGQLRIGGSGYAAAIALDATALNIYHNSASRSIIFGTDETERMRIDSSGAYHTGTVNATSYTVGTIGASSGFLANATNISVGNSTINVAISTGALTTSGSLGGIRPASNTDGTGLGSSSRRWVLNANTGNFSGAVTVSGLLSVDSTIRRTTAGQGWLDGDYSSIETSATTGAIYSIGGASYFPTSSSLNTMYGIGYTYSGTNQFSIGTISGAANNLWGMYVCQNGSPGAFISGTGNIYGAGALVMKGNVTAYSDERVKTNWRDLPANFIEQLAKVKHGVYDRKDKELTQVGVSAQSLQPVLEHAVLENDHGELSVAYGNAALVSAIKLAQQVVELTSKLAALEVKLEQLIKDKP
jgi:hypothetical protein